MKRALAGLAAIVVLLVAPSAAGAATVWAVGDGGDWNPDDDALASRIQSQGPFDRFLYLGDIYETGTAQEWSNYYEPSYGRFRSITSPTPGNHEWATRASGYDPYFGSRAPQNGGGHYYSFDLAGWHVISLNSEEDTSTTSAQVAWLREDLAKYPGTCTIAYFHRPRYTATTNLSNNGLLEPLWAELAGRSVAIINGHHHNYERFKPNRRITQFVVGTGGHFFQTLNTLDTRLDAGSDKSYGALRLDLTQGLMRYDWMTMAGAIADSGSLGCTPHAATPPPNTAPTASFTHSPTAPNTSQAVTFTSTSSDADGTITAQEWDLDDDGAFDDATGASASRSYATSGTYTARLRVTDDAGASTVATRSLTVGNQAPTASFTYSPATPIRRETVTFTSTSADPDGTVASQAWDLDNDGTFDDGTGVTARRSFRSAQTYTVRLRVTDREGAASIVSRPITVYSRRPATSGTAAAMPAPPLAGGFDASFPRVQIRGPRPSARYGRQPKVFHGVAHGVARFVELTLVRRVRGGCRAFDGLRFRRASCATTRSFAAGGTGRWSFRMPIDLPRGNYVLTARARAADGRIAAQSVPFRSTAPVRIRKAPLSTQQDETDEQLEGGTG